MIRTHSYDVTVVWAGNRGSGTSGYREYGRDHEVAVSGDEAGDAGRPQPIAGSSDSAFRGDPGLTGFDQVTVGVADIRADLGGMVLGLGQELGTLRRPLRVRRGDVRDPDVEERAGMAGAGWRRERHAWVPQLMWCASP